MDAAEQQAIKVQYRVENWREYNKALENRYNMTFWFDEKTAYGWYESAKPSEPGRPKTYSDTAIACGLIIKSIFRLPLRGMKGFLSSILQIMGLCCAKRNFDIKPLTPDALHHSRAAFRHSKGCKFIQD
ncbi:transposase [Magnetococcales bacterium HHB-1]